MIQHPLLLLAIFVGLVAGLRNISSRPGLERIFRVLPVPFWCYFLPTLGSTFGILPQSHALYGFLSRQLLPVCLVMLLVGTDLKAISRMGAPAAILMLAGAAGTVLGGLISYALFRRWLPAEAWGGFGTLTASWIGGSANLLAVKEALRVPDAVIAPIILVDAAIAYSWMGLLLWSSALQEKWDKSVGRLSSRAGPPYARRPSVATRSLPPSLVPPPRVARGRDTLPARSVEAGLSVPARGGQLFAIILATSLSLLAQWAGQRLPALGAAITASTWTVLLVTTAALALSLTPLRRLEERGLSRMGSFALYILLTSIGARANLQALAQAPVFLALGLTWIAIHGVVLLAVGLLTRAPLGLIATASQANIGGPISAPIVGAAFSRELASLGLLMAVLGNLLGTYLGLAAALVVRAFG